MRLQNENDRFLKLMHERRDRELREDEQSFFSDFLDKEPEKLASAEDGAKCLNLLQNCTIEPELDSAFDERVLRRARLERSRGGLRYWAPAVMAGGIACLVLLTALQMVLKTSPPLTNPYQAVESRLVRESTPSLELFSEPKFLR